MQSSTLSRIPSILKRGSRNIWSQEVLNKFNKINYVNHFSSIQQSTSNNYVPHIPVLCENAIELLNPGPDKTIIDMTFGSGGHSTKILENFENVKIFALDRDPIAIEYAKLLGTKFPNQIIPILGRFSDIPALMRNYNIKFGEIDGIIFDFGCSSMQYDDFERGFSISKDGPLDMRMNNTDSNQLTAAEILAKIDEIDLAKILKVYGEEKSAKKIARAIIEARSISYKINTTSQLANLVASCQSEICRVDKLQRPAHPATKTFQALRIFVNNELNEINFGMTLSHELLKKNGRIVTITFHSLEDTIVKRHINGNVIEGIANPLPLKYTNHGYYCDRDLVESLNTNNWKQINKHVITPALNEITKNTRSRSAKLRGAVKI